MKSSELSIRSKVIHTWIDRTDLCSLVVIHLSRVTQRNLDPWIAAVKSSLGTGVKIWFYNMRHLARSVAVMKSALNCVNNKAVNGFKYISTISHMISVVNWTKCIWLFKIPWGVFSFAYQLGGQNLFYANACNYSDNQTQWQMLSRIFSKITSKVPHAQMHAASALRAVQCLPAGGVWFTSTAKACGFVLVGRAIWQGFGAVLAIRRTRLFIPFFRFCFSSPSTAPPGSGSDRTTCAH